MTAPEHTTAACIMPEPTTEATKALADDPRQPHHGRLSPAFILLKAERKALRMAYAEAEAAMASAPEREEHETAADAVLARIWESDNRLMATPAAVPDDLSLKADYLAAQLEEFEQLERRHCVAIVADICRLFPATAHAQGAHAMRNTIPSLYAQWLAARAQVAAVEAGADDDDEEGDRDGDLARAIMATPAADARDVFRKIGILEHYMTFDNEPTLWSDSREVLLLASIKADLLRLQPGQQFKE